MWTRLFIMLLILGTTGSAYAYDETFYVRDDGECSFNGNGATSSCAASGGAAGAFSGYYNIAFSATDETAGSVDPGDLIYVCGAHQGGYFHGAADATEPGSGTAGKPVTVSFDCPGNPGSAEAVSAGNYALATFKHHVDIINPILTGGTAYTLHISSSTGDRTSDRYVRILGGNISNNAAVGQKCVNLVGRYITVDNVTVSHCYTDGFWADGKYLTMTRNRVSDVSYGDINGDCIQHSGEVDGSVIGGSPANGNYCDHSLKDSKYCIISTSIAVGEYSEISYNTCKKVSTDTVGAAMYFEHSVLVKGNVMTGGADGVTCVVAATEICDIIGNLIIDANRYGVKIGTGSDLGRVVHNTIVGTATDECVHVDSSAVTTILIQNNLLRDCAIGISTFSALNVNQYNLFYNISGNNLVVNGTPTTPGTGSLLATNPLLVGTTYTTATGKLNGDARLGGASPAKNAGIVTGLCVDIRGYACRPDRHNMGAYQTGSGDQAATRAARTP